MRGKKRSGEQLNFLLKFTHMSETYAISDVMEFPAHGDNMTEAGGEHIALT